MLSAQQNNIRNLSLSELENYFAEIDEKKFRAKQVYEWLWQKHAGSFDAMTNISKDLRNKLADHFSLPALTINATQYSADGTVKSRFETFDHNFV
jgi:23S rRNA (adenine2503-C2)-methyltransferase